MCRSFSAGSGFLLEKVVHTALHASMLGWCVRRFGDTKLPDVSNKHSHVLVMLVMLEMLAGDTRMLAVWCGHCLSLPTCLPCVLVDCVEKLRNL